jgi:DNA (cytosine-5)-methyltransferase 1
MYEGPDETRRTLALSPRHEPAQRLSVVGLFAGIGGLELGLELAGHRTTFLCEIMPEAKAVLSAAAVRDDDHRAFAGASMEGDITSSDFAAKLPSRIDVLAAGFPCQDLSQAGRTNGIKGSRSALIGHVLTLLEGRRRAGRPRWIILENVSFMRHLGGGVGMDVVLNGLSKLGYAWAYREIDTLAFGLPQRRKRLFIVACLLGEGDPKRVLFDGDFAPDEARRGAGWRHGRACGFYWTEGNRGVGWADDAVPTLKGGSGLGIPSPPAIILPPTGEIVVPTIRDVERLQGFPRGWTEAAANADHRGERKRWILAGNAVSVPVARWIGERLAMVGQPLDLDGHPLPPGSKWPPAAWRVDPDGPRFTAPFGGWPVQSRRTSLLSLLKEEEGSRPALSLKAASGFLSRFEASNLLKRDPDLRAAFLEILRSHVDRASQPC